MVEKIQKAKAYYVQVMQAMQKNDDDIFYLFQINTIDIIQILLVFL